MIAPMQERAEQGVDADRFGRRTPRRARARARSSRRRSELSRPWRSYSRLEPAQERADDEEHRERRTRPTAPPSAWPATGPSARAMPTTNASMHHAVTSSTAAQVIAIAPTLVLCRLRSVRMRASTGNAVMLIAAPMNSATDVKRICGVSLNSARVEVQRQRRAEQERRDDADVADDHRGVPAVSEQLADRVPARPGTGRRSRRPG